MNILKTPEFLSLLLIISGCTHNFYTPNIQNVPLFQQKKEFHLSLDGSVGNDFQGFEAQTAFSVADYLGFMVNGFYNNNEWRIEGMNEYLKGYLIEGGAGTFIPLNSNMVFEAYTGAGFGKSENGYFYDATSKLNFNRYFIQPSIGYTTDPVDLAISLRLSGLQYSNIHFTGNLDQKYQEQIQYIDGHPFSILLEPALTFRRGWQHMKLQLQLGYSINVSNPDLPQEHVSASIGLYITISNKFRKSNN